MSASTAPGQAPTVDQPKYPLGELTTYELRDYRHQLERAITFYTAQSPELPAQADLQPDLDSVRAEQDDRARIARA